MNYAALDVYASAALFKKLRTHFPNYEHWAMARNYDPLPFPRRLGQNGRNLGRAPKFGQSGRKG